MCAWSSGTRFFRTARRSRRARRARPPFLPALRVSAAATRRFPQISQHSTRRTMAGETDVRVPCVPRRELPPSSARHGGHEHTSSRERVDRRAALSRASPAATWPRRSKVRPSVRFAVLPARLDIVNTGDPTTAVIFTEVAMRIGDLHVDTLRATRRQGRTSATLDASDASASLI